MDKNEILEKSRMENENGDERQLNGIKNAGNIAVFVGLIVCLIFVFIRQFILDEDAYDLQCLFWSMSSTNHIVQYIYLKKKIYLASAILGFWAVIMYFISYIMNLIG